MNLILEIVSGPHAGQKVELSPGRTAQVGRASWAEFSLPDVRSLAGLHFEVACGDDSATLRVLARTHTVSVNNAPVREARLRHGDRIGAGDLTFGVHFAGLAAPAPPVPPPPPAVADAPPAVPTMARPAQPATFFKKDETDRALPVPPETPLPGARNDLLKALRQAQPLYAILDAARDPRVLELLQAEIESYESLFEGAEGKELAEWAPYLVRLPPMSALIEALVREGWGESWGVFLTCHWPIRDLRKHFRRFLMVEMEGQGEVYFRFYDPRVLRVFLPTCTPEEAVQFFGPVRAFLTEDKVPEILLKFSAGKQGVQQDMAVLGLEREAGAGRR